MSDSMLDFGGGYLRQEIMRTLIGAAIALTALAGVANAQNQPPQPPLRMAASSFASVEVHVNQRPIGRRWWEEDASLTGPARIAITHGQPHARGRKVEGGLVPIDTVWRFGANTATTLHTDVDLTLGGLAVPRGDYSLFILNGRAGWQLVINRQTAQWGTDYDASRDLGRIPLASRKMAEPQESLAIFLVPQSANPAEGYGELRGVMRVQWGTTELSTNWVVKQ